MLYGHHEQMRRCLRVEVFDRNNVFVAIDYLCRYLSGTDLTENAIGHQCERIVKFQDLTVVLPASSETRTVTWTGPSG